MRQHLLAALWSRLPHQQGPCHVERARDGAGAAAVDIAANIQQVSAWTYKFFVWGERS